MKKRLRRILLLLVFVLIIFVIWYFIPKQMNHTFEGMLYRLGTENINFQKSVVIEVDGTLQKSIWGSNKFKGTIVIDSEVIPPSYAEVDELELSIKKDDGVYVAYWIESSSGIGWSSETFGKLYINDDFSEFTIAKMEQGENGGSSWNGRDGLMISAPATNRSEALGISNKLMEDYLMEHLK